MNGKSGQTMRQILGRVSRDEFVGRADELRTIVSHPTRPDGPNALLVLLAPAAGVSELLRQAYDELFNRHEEVVPIYFAIQRSEATAVSVAIEFLNTFLLQYVAFRRNEPSLCRASLVLADILKLAPPADYDWIEQLVDTYQRGRFSDDHKGLVRFCFSAPQRVPRANARPFVMVDAVKLRGTTNAQFLLDSEIIRILDRSQQPYALAGLRRQVLHAAHHAGTSFERAEILRLDKLGEGDARKLAEIAARRQQVALSDETRDLMVQQFDSSPFFISAMLEAAREKNVSLTSYLACEQLYVDELMGGQLHRHFTTLLEDVAPRPETRRTLLRLLSDASVSGHKASFAAWRKLLDLEVSEFEQLLRGLHVQELINWDGNVVDANHGPLVWNDFLKIRFRLDVENASRALVVAETIAAVLKRAPHTMAIKYRQAARLPLRELLGRFNSQLVPRIMFHHDRFKEAFLGVDPPDILSGLDAQTELMRLPQVVHTASAAAFSRSALLFGDNESCVVAHAFEGAVYADASEVVWLAAQIDSKLEVDRAVAELWVDRLEALANECGFHRIRILLVANEGFSADAATLLNNSKIYSASRQQVELLSSRLGETGETGIIEGPNEFVAILPMGDDNELLAASMVEQIARRSNFKPEAINQIKTAIVEACINASEHSLSPDRKIYQRFRLENDRLVITISSRGVVPTKQSTGESRKPTQDFEPSEGRRGWGLKLIRSLMDEVEFEQVDDGTSLRMTKYLRNSSS